MPLNFYNFLSSNNAKGKLILIHQNIRSLRKNFDMFIAEVLTQETFPDIIILTEIWIYQDEKMLYEIPGYTMEGSFNEKYRAGGVVVYLKNEICQCLSFIKLEFRSSDALHFSFKFNCYNFDIISIYRLHEHSVNYFCDEISDYFFRRENSKSKLSNFFIIGDINIDILVKNTENDNYKFVMSYLGFESLINCPTRIAQCSAGGTEQITKTCIDHIFARIPDKNKISVKCEVVDAGITDHCMCVAVLELKGQTIADDAASLPVTGDASRFRIDYALLREKLLNVDWSAVYSSNDASQAYDIFVNILQDLIHFSKKEIRKKYVFKKIKPWMTDNICARIQFRQFLYKKLKNNENNRKLKQNYIRYRNKLHNDIVTQKQNYYRNVFENCKGNQKETWRVLNEVTGQKTRAQSNYCLEVNNDMITDQQKVAEEFNKYFLTVVDTLSCQYDKNKEVLAIDCSDLFPDVRETSSIFVTPVSVEELEKIVSSLKSGKSPGHDGLSSHLVKSIFKEISKVLVYLINLSISTGVFPYALKESIVIPIHKKGVSTCCSNFRPISLVPTFSKIYEKIMKQRVVRYLEKIKFFSNNQFGFREGLSTESAIMEFINKVNNGINDNKKVSGLFLDIAKAFDTVNHKILLEKLFNCGIRGVAYNWFCSFLVNRRQRVRINGFLSGEGVIKHGVPQGSVMGPILFLIYINDLCNGNFNGTVTSFADDTALCYVQSNHHAIEQAINKDLLVLRWWFVRNNMVLSPEKTVFIDFSLRSEVKVSKKIVYKCFKCLGKNSNCDNSCVNIKECKDVKYLGINIDNELNWKVHISKLIGKLNQQLRVFYFLRELTTIDVLRTVYFSLVHSKLEYGISAWGGTYISNISSLMVLQKHFIRIISRSHVRVSSMPLFIKLDILPLRHLFFYKTIKIFLKGKWPFIFVNNIYRDRLRGQKNIPVPKPNNTHFTKTYPFLAPRLYNRLPDEIKNIDKIKYFLKRLRIWLLLQSDIEEHFRIIV
jgi:hypothetical protein